MTNKKSYEFLGRGWSFPPTFSKDTKGVEILEDEDNIAKSVKLIVLTRVGERFFHPELGTDLNAFAFMRNIDSAEKNRIKRMVEYAIMENEVRVVVDQVDVQNNQDDDCIEIAVAYTIKGFNTKYNMVFPFYLENGIG